MSAYLVFVIPAGVLVFVGVVHYFFRSEKRICGTYPYYQLRDQIIWEMIKDPDRAAEKKRFYQAINRIVHLSSWFGWKFVSEAVQEVTHAILEDRKPVKRGPLEVALVDLVLASAKSNSLLVRLALTSTGRWLFLYPILKACYQYTRRKKRESIQNAKSDSRIETGIMRRVETVRRVRRLHHWRQTAVAA